MSRSVRSYNDDRGRMFFPIDENTSFLSKQCTISQNHKHVFRGLHVNNFVKLVTCIQGAILDIIVDLNLCSDNYLIPVYYNMRYDGHNQVLVPKGFAHGFLTLEENTIVVYHFDGVFKPEETRHISYLDPFINIILPTKKIILSQKDQVKNFVKPIDYIVLGGNGFLGSYIMKVLYTENKNVLKLDTRLENIGELCNKLKLYDPKYVINAAGLTGTPNTTWCDTNKEATIETNITFQLTLCKICNDQKIHLTIFGSGGIFQPSKVRRLETEKGDKKDSFYSRCRINLEEIVNSYPNILYLRINYPLSSFPNQKNLLTKIQKFHVIDDKSLSITCLDTMFPIIPKLIENNELGIRNFVNPDAIRLSMILQKYYNYMSINKSVTISKHSQDDLLLDTTSLQKYNVSTITDSLHTVFKTIKDKNL